MNLFLTLTLYGGGPGSGCKGDDCGRPSTALTTQQTNAFLKNTRVLDIPPSANVRGPAAMQHYVVNPDGTVEKLSVSHIDYFRRKGDDAFGEFMSHGGMLVTVAAGGPGVTVGTKDEASANKVIQLLNEPVFRSYQATVMFLDKNEKQGMKEFDGDTRDIAKQIRQYVAK